MYLGPFNILYKFKILVETTVLKFLFKHQGDEKSPLFYTRDYPLFCICEYWAGTLSEVLKMTIYRIKLLLRLYTPVMILALFFLSEHW